MLFAESGFRYAPSPRPRRYRTRFPPLRGGQSPTAYPPSTPTHLHVLAALRAAALSQAEYGILLLVFHQWTQDVSLRSGA